MDVSEVWPFVKLAAVVVLGGVAFWVLRRVRSGWVRIPARLLAAGTTTISFLVLVLFAVTEQGCSMRAPALWSPDGGHLALVRWGMQGALGADGAIVRVRPRGGWSSEIVFRGAGWAGSAPALRWLDDTRLEIRYWDERVYEHRCGERVEGVEIVCVRPAPTSS